MTWDGRSSKLVDLGALASAVSPHQITDQHWYRNLAGVVMGTITIVLGADLGAGNIVNTDLAALSGVVPPIVVGSQASPTGPVLAAYLSQTGSIGVSATAAAIASGTTISMSFVYLPA